MKVMQLTFTLNFLFVFSTYAQNGWYFQNPIPTTSELNSVQFVTEDTGWAIGSCATIIHTTDGGENWKLQYVEEIEHITDMSFVDSEYGWIIGYRYTGEYVWGYPITQPVLLKTENGGINWELIQIWGDHSYSPLSVFFIDRKTGWINCIPEEGDYNCKIMKTIDGGKNWIEQKKVRHGINSIFFINSMTGWAVGGWSSAFQVAILKTDDGGENWISQNGGVNGVLESVYFVDDDIGWAVGTEGNVLKTEDGGENWINISDGLKFSGSNQFLSVYFSDANRGFITGWFDFLSTNDGGENWTIYEQSFQETYLSVFFINSEIGWRVGTEGSIQKTIDGGESWKNQSECITREELIHVDFVDESKGWIISSNSVFHTENGGFSWKSQQSISQQDGSLNYLYAVDSLTSWVVGYDRNHSSSLILKTKDGGNQWDIQQVNYNLALNCSHFINKDVGWIVGESGIILSTNNGGKSWTQQESGTTEDLISVDFINASIGWISCINGSILHTDNGGKNWIIYFQSGNPILGSIDFVDSLNGWAVDEDLAIESNDDGAGPPSGYIFHTNDGGKNWEQQVEKYGGFSSVKFLNDKVGWAAGENLWYTKDGGENWALQRISVCGIRSMDFIDLNTGWLVGSNNAIVHTTNWEITFIEDPNKQHLNTPENFILNQNYPNPFNPTTVISWQLAVGSNVKLSIYNILGQKIQTLLNKPMPAGHHEVEFNGQNLSSGVYLYRIEAGEFQDVKKMILLR